MFSINPCGGGGEVSGGNTLHSTMFSINRSPFPFRKPPWTSLHSTMFSINQCFPNTDKPYSTLYIPLCFLLIQIKFHGYFQRRTLHSTMFSINLWFHYFSSRISFLYIPLCFLLIPAGEQFGRRYDGPLHSTMFSINHLEAVWDVCRI